MISLLTFLGVVFLKALSVAGQGSASRWCDSWTGVCFQRLYDAGSDSAWGYVFPPSPRSEFIGIFTAPIRTGWIGASLGGGMTNNPLVVSWVNGNTPVISVRYTTQYGPPPVMNNAPRVTILGTSGVNATHQRIVYRCENCTTWSGGSGGINQNGNHVFGYATHTTMKPGTPSNPGSSLSRHTIAGQHSLNTVDARSATYDAQLAALIAAPPLAPGSPPPIITTSTPIVTPTTTVLRLKVI
ncbi:cellobiose dehydrogenase [Coprinopsis cinerea AmutBmut pab1-1]|nr:cellobiose dehydrogenase [Coprinopsis cinerea AmutBmut pab1-1]